jgi:hypothetical protein
MPSAEVCTHSTWISPRWSAGIITTELAKITGMTPPVLTRSGR